MRKFNENDRNGIAANVSYVAADETVRLRGGDPTVWDSRGRTKAVELDSDLCNRRFVCARQDHHDLLQSGTDQRRNAILKDEESCLHRE